MAIPFYVGSLKCFSFPRLTLQIFLVTQMMLITVSVVISRQNSSKRGFNESIIDNLFDPSLLSLSHVADCRHAPTMVIIASAVCVRQDSTYMYMSPMRVRRIAFLSATERCFEHYMRSLQYLLLPT